MKHLISCANAGEAGFYRSLLASSGIEAEIRDSRADLGSIPSAQLFVAAEQHAQATELIAGQSMAPSGKPFDARHPATGFPFLGIMGFTAIVWTVGTLLLSVTFHFGAWQQLTASDVLLQLLRGVVYSFPVGLVAGVWVALVCLLVKVTWTRLRTDPATLANSSRPTD